MVGAAIKNNLKFLMLATLAVGAAAMFVWDYTLTFRMEVDLV